LDNDGYPDVVTSVGGDNTIALFRSRIHRSSSGLVAHYPFNGNANDESGNGHNGTTSGTTLTSDRFANNGAAYSFDGVADLITVPDGPGLNPPVITLSAWIKPATGNGLDRGILSKYGDASEAQYMLMLMANNRIRAQIATSQGVTFVDGSTDALFQTWIHVCMTYDGSTIELYMNGYHESSVGASGSLNITSQSLQIGHYSTGSNYFPGSIDDIRIYDRALSAEEVESAGGGPRFRSEAGRTIHETVEWIAHNADTWGERDGLIRKPSDGVGRRLVEARGVASGYRVKSLVTRRRLRAIHDVSFHIREHEFVGFIGNSGEGKSTIGLALTGLAEIFGGAIEFGADLVDRRDGRKFYGKVQYLVQDAASSFDPSETIGRSLRLAARSRGIGPDRATAEITSLCDQLSLGPAELEKLPHQLSGGERQRFAVIRALMGDTQFLVADEPFVHLDVGLQKRLWEMLIERQSRATLTCVLISHDLGHLLGLCNRIYTVANGTIGGELTAEGWTSSTAAPLFRAAAALGQITRLPGSAS
jgi:ABC-type dipeptide/oligopeptide/nickel transport system ATPase subunit